MTQKPTPERLDTHILAALRSFAILGSIAAVLLGLLALAGWLRDGQSGGTGRSPLSMAPSAGIGFVLAGLSLCLRHGERVRPDRGRGAAADAVAGLLFAGSTVLLVLALPAHHDLLDPLLSRLAGLPEAARHRSTAPTSLLCFTLLGGALLGRTRPPGLLRRLGGLCCPLGLLVSGLAMLGYAYDVDRLRTLIAGHGIAGHTAIGLFVLFLVCLAANPERGWMALVASGRPAAAGSRGQLVLATAIPFLIGLAALDAERRGLVTPAAAMALVVAGTVVTLVTRILRDGRVLEELETRRLHAVTSQRRLTEELERRVRDRTASLALSEARLRSYFDNAPEGLMLFRVLPDGAVRLEEVSASMRAMYALGQSAPELIRIETLFGQEDRIDIDRQFAICLNSDRPHRYIARRLINGERRVFDVILAPVASAERDGGRVIAGSVRDMTESEAREETLRQSQKMEAVGQLTGGLAHDFNNLLTGITGSLELLDMRIAQGRTEQLSRYIDTAQVAAARAAALTHRLLAFSRRQTLDPRLADVGRIAAGMEELIRRTVGPSIELVLSGPGTGPGTDPGGPGTMALIDANQLENALLNLCLNARDAMPGGGRLLVGVETLPGDGTGPGAEICLSVQDTGSGMTPEVMARAFDPFFTTKPLGQGTGLGLSMIHGFVHQSGGRVRIDSAPERGTRVELRLPLHAAPAALPAAPGPGAGRMVPPEHAASPPGRTILVVDDEAAVRAVVVELLDELGYRTLEAEDAAGGLAILRSGVAIDLLVSDVGLPGPMNGRQLGDAARALRPELRILFITGYAEAAVLSQGDLAPRMEVLTKPFTIGQLTRRIEALLEEPQPG